MRIFDKKLKTQRKYYLFQICIATLTMIGLLFLYDIINSASIIASLASTTFIVFAMPHRDSARPRRTLGGYLVCSVCGVLGYYCYQLLPNAHFAIVGGIAIGFSMLMMVMFDFEHPPSAAYTLGLTLSPTPLQTTLLTLLCVMIIAAVKHFLKKWMIDLV